MIRESALSFYSPIKVSTSVTDREWQRGQVMKSLLLSSFVLVLLMSFSVPARADFELIRKIPAPMMACEAGSPIIKAMGSDGTYICLTRGCYLDGGARVIRIDPDDGDIVNDDYWNYAIPQCPSATMPISMSFCPYDGAYYVGTECGAIVGLLWQAADSAWAFTTYTLGDSLLVPSGMAPGQYSFLFGTDQDDNYLVKFESIGIFMADTHMGDVDFPVAMAAYDQHLFVLDSENYFIVEMTNEAVAVDTHYVQDWVSGGLTGTFSPEAATFLGEHLYLAGNTDSIHVYEMVEEISYTEPVPEGDSVEVVLIPEELVLTFDAVTDSGDVHVEVGETDDCAPPAGVTLFAEYYDIATDATFEYVTEVAVLDSVFPPGVDDDLARVFSRPSDTCGVWRDITVAPVEEIPVLKILRRSKSEDDEFSIFAVGEDNRTPQEVVEYKIADLRGHIVSAEDSIPEAAYNDILGVLNRTEDHYYRGLPAGAAEELGAMEEDVRGDPLIPHTYDPVDPGRNVAGRIISRAHTLEFSLGFSEAARYYSGATVVPHNIHVGVRFDWLVVFIEVPGALNAAEVDVHHIYLDNQVRAVPESTLVFDFDTDGAPEVRAMFPGTAAQLALAGSGCTSLANTSCFVGGFELHSVGEIDLTEPVVHVAGGGALLSGTAVGITWDRFECPESSAYRLAFSADGGATWDLIASDLIETDYDWLVPDTPTETGILRVACAEGGEAIAMYSGLLTLQSGAGVDVEHVSGFELALRPNPSSGAVEIEFSAAKGGHASVTVYSVRGELVRRVFDGRVDGGLSRIVWDGDNGEGKPVSAGTYFVVLRAETGTITKKMVMQR
jgi:hypothetical protein